MATKVTKTTSKNSKLFGNKTKTVEKDTGRMTGRQKTKQGMSKNAVVTTLGSEAAATVLNATREREKTKREEAKNRSNNYIAAINKWNGILKSTPDNAEGTDPGMEGSSSNSTSTGTNPGDGDGGFKGW